MRQRLIGLALWTVLLAAACGQGSSPAPGPGDGCVQTGTRGVRTLTVAGPAGERIDVIVLGGGTTGVVLSDQSDRDLCSWVPFAHTLTSRGFRVYLHDTLSSSQADEVAAVAAAARQDGVGRLLLMGASEGAKASLVAGSRLTPPPDAVITLSAESKLDGEDVLPSVRQLEAPLLLVTADWDIWGSASASRSFYDAAPNQDKHLVTVSGWDHGIDLLNNTKGVASPVLAFLDAHAH